MHHVEFTMKFTQKYQSKSPLPKKTPLTQSKLKAHNHSVTHMIYISPVEGLDSQKSNGLLSKAISCARKTNASVF